jgi:hypothetical protein
MHKWWILLVLFVYLSHDWPHIYPLYNLFHSYVYKKRGGGTRKKSVNEVIWLWSVAWSNISVKRMSSIPISIHQELLLSLWVLTWYRGFQVREAQAEYKVGSMGSWVMGCYDSDNGQAYRSHNPSESILWEPTLNGVAPHLQVIHKLGPTLDHY